MEGFYFFIYRLFVIPVFTITFYIGSLFNQKIKQGVKGRKEYFKKLKESVREFPVDKKRIMFHAASVGEWLQAAPILELLKKNNPDLIIVVSFFSPSGYNYVKKHPDVDLKIYLPIDSRCNARKLFEMIKPQLWIVSKFDVWPNHLKMTAKLNIPSILTAATLSEDSGRNKGLMKIFSKVAYKYFDQIFPISEDDSKRFQELYPYPDKIKITGDTRFDSVYNKREQVEKGDVIKLFNDDEGLKIIAGSIWPTDEKHLLPALIKLYKKYDIIKLILVPHELHESHLSQIEKLFYDNNISLIRYSDMKGKPADTRIVMVDAIGMLAGLYRISNIAYVGGSFSKGVHNVMEPAVFNQPVIFGPNHLNSFEALELMKIGCAFTAKNEIEMQSILDKLIQDDGYRNEAGENAKKLIEDNLGATERIYNILTKKYGFISKIHSD